MTDFSKYEVCDLNNSYGIALHNASVARGFYDFANADIYQSILHCDDTGKNRSLLITAMCSNQHERLDLTDKVPNSRFDLALYRIKKMGKWHQLLFLDGDDLEMDPICLAVWDEKEQDWLVRL